LYYIGFLKHVTVFWGSSKLQDKCKILTSQDTGIGGGCYYELTIQLVSLLLTNMIVGQLKEVGLPYLMTHFSSLPCVKKKPEEEEKPKLPIWEEQAKLQDWAGTIDEYTEMVIQYGEVTLFAASFPPAPLLAVLNNIIEIRTDGFKMLTSITRPLYHAARDIGTWYQILEILGYIAVLTNCMLIAFTFSSIDITFNGNALYALIFGIVLEHVIIVLKFLIAIAVPDMPGDVQKALSRQNFIKESTLKAREGTLINYEWKDKWNDNDKEESSEDEPVDEEKKKKREKKLSKKRKSKKKEEKQSLKQEEV